MKLPNTRLSRLPLILSPRSHGFRLIASLLLVACCVPGLVANNSEASSLTPEEITQLIRKANNRWQATNPEHGDAFWNRAVYHVGNLEAYDVTREPSYLRYSEAWAEHNEWKGAKSEDRSEWLFSYGETDAYVLFGDWQVCFQVYMQLYELRPDALRIKRVQEVLSHQISTPNNNYIWWSDGFFMVMPTMTQLHAITGNDRLLLRLRDYFDYACELMYNEESGLFFRDAKYIFPKHTTLNGKKDFWSRGNGWVFAALPRVLDDLPQDHRDREHYLKIYRAMAARLATAQQAGGYWTRSLLDPAHSPGPESSGTAFFTYGYLWGLRNGILEEATYRSVANKGWVFLVNTALQPDGTVGYIQPIGEKAIPEQSIGPRSTSDFGVGAFLMAAAEKVRLHKSLNLPSSTHSR